MLTYKATPLIGGERQYGRPRRCYGDDNTPWVVAEDKELLVESGSDGCYDREAMKWLQGRRNSWLKASMVSTKRKEPKPSIAGEGGAIDR